MSDENVSDEKMSEMLAIVETIENGNIMVSASPEMWVDGHILYRPPELANRRDTQFLENQTGFPKCAKL